MVKIYFAVLIFLLSTGCSSLSRSPQSGYGNEYGTPAYGYTRDFGHSSNSGIDTYALGTDERNAMQDRIELKKLETRLTSEIERQQYFKYRPFLRSDKERIEFLGLPDLRARTRWLQAKGYIYKTDTYNQMYESVAQEGDLVLGMPKQAVRESWGDPELVEVAGNPTYENERWLYSTYLTTDDGYQKEDRYVYFEGGRVVGWEKR